MIIYRALLGDPDVVTERNKKEWRERRRPRDYVRPTNRLPDSTLGESQEHGGTLPCREMILYDDGRSAYPEYLVKFKRLKNKKKNKLERVGAKFMNFLKIAKVRQL
jgi:hypothetical protein